MPFWRQKCNSVQSNVISDLWNFSYDVRDAINRPATEGTKGTLPIVFLCDWSSELGILWAIGVSVEYTTSWWMMPAFAKFYAYNLSERADWCFADIGYNEFWRVKLVACAHTWDNWNTKWVCGFNEGKLRGNAVDSVGNKIEVWQVYFTARVEAVKDWDAAHRVYVENTGFCGICFKRADSWVQSDKLAVDVSDIDGIVVYEREMRPDTWASESSLYKSRLRRLRKTATEASLRRCKPSVPRRSCERENSLSIKSVLVVENVIFFCTVIVGTYTRPIAAYILTIAVPPHW